jgi:uncharacterized membrane protein
MTNTYLLLKSLHVLGAILLLGNIIVTAWWKMSSDFKGDPVVAAFAQRQVTLTDWVFTATGVLLVGITGTLNATLQGTEAFSLKWVQWGYGLFVASGVIWAAVLIPIQIRQARLARAFSPGEPIPTEYRRLSLLWAIFGSLATALLFVNIYWMVYKPV